MIGSSVVAHFFSLFSIATEYTMTQSNSTIIIHDYGIQGRNSSRSRIRNSDHMLPSHDSFYLFFLYNQGPPAYGQHHEQRTEPSHINYSSRKSTHSFVYRLICWKHFLSWSFLCSDDYTACVKLTKQNNNKEICNQWVHSILWLRRKYIYDSLWKNQYLLKEIAGNWEGLCPFTTERLTLETESSACCNKLL